MNLVIWSICLAVMDGLVVEDDVKLVFVDVTWADSTIKLYMHMLVNKSEKRKAWDLPF